MPDEAGNVHIAKLTESVVSSPSTITSSKK